MVAGFITEDDVVKHILLSAKTIQRWQVRAKLLFIYFFLHVDSRLSTWHWWLHIDRVGTNQCVCRHQGVEKNPFYLQPIHSVPILFAFNKANYLLNVLVRCINIWISILLTIYTHNDEIRYVKWACCWIWLLFKIDHLFAHFSLLFHNINTYLSHCVSSQPKCPSFMSILMYN